MRVREHVLHCDGDGPDGIDCGAWDLDFWEQNASTVNGVRITATERNPGWTTTGDEDYCPRCSAARPDSAPTNPAPPTERNNP